MARMLAQHGVLDICTQDCLPESDEIRTRSGGAFNYIRVYLRVIIVAAALEKYTKNLENSTAFTKPHTYRLFSQPFSQKAIQDY